jgi:hypothetical protein
MKKMNKDSGADAMEKYTREELAEALRVVSSTIGNCEKMQPKFAEGTSQHTLLKNRIKALRIAEALTAGENIAGRYANEELEEALRPVASIISKCEKAQLKFAEGTSHHTRFESIIKAMHVSKALIEDEIAKSVFYDVEIKLKKRNKILFSRDSRCLQELISLIGLQKHRAVAMWALDCGRVTLEQFEAKYPQEHRPRTCLEVSEAWAKGKVKMPAAKKAILASHAAAKEIDDSEYGALCHAIGHAGAAVHVETHALGLVFYELTAVVLRCGKDNYREPVTEKIKYYKNRLLYWQENTDKLGLEWAGFLLDDTRPNKEKLLNEKRKQKEQKR